MIENDLFIFLLDVGINPSACRGGREPCRGVGTKMAARIMRTAVG